MNTDHTEKRTVSEEETIAETIIWLAKEKIKSGVPYQNINSAIHGVMMDVNQHVLAYMDKHK
jgi:hypothetical protein